jgi:hypothetical protein
MAEGLVGRRWELRALVELLRTAQSGRGLLLIGDSGIGTTNPFWKCYRLNP